MRPRTCECNQCPTCASRMRKQKYRDNKRGGKPGKIGRPCKVLSIETIKETIRQLEHDLAAWKSALEYKNSI